MATALFIKPEDLKRNTIIDGSVDEDKFMGYIKLAQNIHIQNYLGTKLYERLQAGIIAGDLTANEITLIDDYIQDALIHFAMAEYFPFSTFQVNNGGVFKHTSENAVQVDQSDVENLAKKERSYAEYYAKRLVDYLCTNSSLYPEYSANTDNDIPPDKQVQYSGSWYFGGAQDNKSTGNRMDDYLKNDLKYE